MVVHAIEHSGAVSSVSRLLEEGGGRWVRIPSRRQRERAACLLSAYAILPGLFVAVLGLFRCDGQEWKLTSAPQAEWSSVACSADGRTLLAAEWIGLIHVSTNAGATWELAGAPNTTWGAVACSADGTRMVAARTKGPAIYLSTNTGCTWVPAAAPGQSSWVEVASSASGARLVATGDGPLLSSGNYGLTWTNYSLPGYAICIAMSADGARLAAEAQGPYSPVFVSTNSGFTWAATDAVNDYPGGVAISADGTKMLAASYSFDIGGPVYVSTNGGASWVAAPVPNRYWDSVCCSSDGTIQAAVGGDLYLSVDSGQTWKPTTFHTTAVTRLASSADGCRLVAATYSEGISIREVTPHPVLKITLVGAKVLLSWIVPSQPFVLQQSPGLAATNWVEVATPPVLNYANLHHEVTLPAPDGPMFYRLKAR